VSLPTQTLSAFPEVADLLPVVLSGYLLIALETKVLRGLLLDWVLNILLLRLNRLWLLVIHRLMRGEHDTRHVSRLLYSQLL
jgi:hypothetical protein